VEPIVKNFLRRLFSQPEETSKDVSQENTAPTAVQDPVPAAAPEPLTVVKTTDAEAVTNEAAVPAENLLGKTTPLGDGRFNIMDGATRPLSPDMGFLNAALNATNFSNHILFGQASDIGVIRSNNQDAAYSFLSTGRSSEERPDFGLFIIADGMGGHHDGEKASAISTRSMATQITHKIFLPLITSGRAALDAPITETLNDSVLKANNDVIAHVPDGGTTLTAVTIIGDLAYVAHVGDSRVYLLNNGTIEQVTRDHSLVQRLLELDQLTPEEAADHPQKNVLYRALGQNDNLEVDTLTRRLPPRARLLLCSDGLWNQVEEQEILEIVLKNVNPQDSCNQLVAMANSRGGIDNVSVILLQMPG
jgi:PPM family protein phosphatase